MSYDCELYLNETSEVFKYKTATLDQIDLGWVWSFTGNKHDFVVGNRNGIGQRSHDRALARILSGF